MISHGKQLPGWTDEAWGILIIAGKLRFLNTFNPERIRVSDGVRTYFVNEEGDCSLGTIALLYAKEQVEAPQRG